MRDDAGGGRLLSRREAMALLGTAGAASLTSAFAATDSVPACVVLPDQTEGPYFIDGRLERADIRSDPESGTVTPGAPLALTFAISRLAGRKCGPLAGAQVDVWHCDALGVYSGVDDLSFSTRGQQFLRGYQLTDSRGEARFTTIYPGWYPGRTVHVHFKVRTSGRDAGREFSSQLYFDDALTDRVHAAAPYVARGARRRRNADDGIFRRGGEQLMPVIRPAAQGYVASFALALQMG